MATRPGSVSAATAKLCLGLGLWVAWPHIVEAQLAGTAKVEMHPPMTIARCTKAGGCILEQANVTLDANWRWIHTQHCSGGQCYSAGDCYNSGRWDREACKDPKSCAEECALEGVDADQYSSTYGVSPVAGGVELKFVSMGAGGMNVGSRLYLMDTEETYKLFRLKQKEFSFDVDVSNLPCGLNGAVYFSEMERHGGKGGGNSAGAKFGTGYCDAQCPHDVKFMNGKANVLDWNETATTGSWGACCAEMDIWEANKAATAYTPHPCDIEGTAICEGLKCGDTLKGERYKGICDKDGCDFNSFRLGDHSFFGEGVDFTIDTSKPLTVVTQWLTSDGTEHGDLTEIRRLYVQDGRVIRNSKTSALGDGKEFNSITDEFCSAQKQAFGDKNDYAAKGGLKSMGRALDRGMVLVMSLWDDFASQMLWLDSVQGRGGEDAPGVLRGPCPTSSGKPAGVRAKYSDASVRYTNFMYGEIDSTYTAPVADRPEAAEGADEEYTTRLKQYKASPAPPGLTGASPVQVLQQPQPQQPRPQQPQPQQPQPALAGGVATSIAGCGAAYQQCTTCCQGACTCVFRGGGYSQCVPPGNAYTCGISSASAPAIATAALPAPAPAPAVLLRAAAAPAKPLSQTMGVRHPTGLGVSRGYCCFAAVDATDFCGSCKPRGRAGADSWCERNETTCKLCGGSATWCPTVAGVRAGGALADLTGVVMKSRKAPVNKDGGILPPLVASFLPAAAMLAALGLLAARDLLRSISGDRDNFGGVRPPPSPSSPYELVPPWSRYLQIGEILTPAAVVAAEARGSTNAEVRGLSAA